MINYAVQCLLFELVKTNSMTVLYQIKSFLQQDVCETIMEISMKAPSLPSPITVVLVGLCATDYIVCHDRKAQGLKWDGFLWLLSCQCSYLG